MAPRYVLDASALLVLIQDEPGADRVEALLEGAGRHEAAVTITAVNLGEVLYQVERRGGRAVGRAVLAALDRIPVPVLPVDRDLAVGAARLKAWSGLAYADCFAAAAAVREDAVLVTGDGDFHRVAGHVTIEWLPPATDA